MREALERTPEVAGPTMADGDARGSRGLRRLARKHGPRSNFTPASTDRDSHDCVLWWTNPFAFNSERGPCARRALYFASRKPTGLTPRCVCKPGRCRASSRDSEPTARLFSDCTMTTTKSLFVAALLSSAAVVSFAQAPAAAKVPAGATTTQATATAPADAASATKHHSKKHHTPKTDAVAPTATTTK